MTSALLPSVISRTRPVPHPHPLLPVTAQVVMENSSVASASSEAGSTRSQEIEELERFIDSYVLEYQVQGILGDKTEGELDNSSKGPQVSAACARAANRLANKWNLTIFSLLSLPSGRRTLPSKKKEAGRLPGVGAPSGR